MEIQHLTIEETQHLGQLGIDITKASFRMEQWASNMIVDDTVELAWGKLLLCMGYNADHGSKYENLNYKSYPVFVIEDMLKLLPDSICLQTGGIKSFLYLCRRPKTVEDQNTCYWVCGYGDLKEFLSEDIIEVVYRMLCWLAENKLMTGLREYRTFDDLVFKEDRIKNENNTPGKCAYIQFFNGYSVSVLCCNGVFSNGIDTFEVGILGKDGSIIPIPDGISGYLTKEEVTELMIKVQNFN